MARPNWEYVRIDVLLMEHPKVEELSDRAFRALIGLWCYAGRQHSDGIVTERQWKSVPPKARAELLAVGLVDPIDIGGAVVMHDFTGPNGHQRTRKEIDELSLKRAEAGRRGGSVGKRLLLVRSKQTAKQVLSKPEASA